MLAKAQLIVWIALAACGGGAASSAPTAGPGMGTGPAPAPGGAEVSCQQAVDGMFAVVAANEPPDLRALSSKVFVHRCEADRWSAEIRGCMAAVKVPEDGDRCEQLLTHEQRRELTSELSRELDAAGVTPEMGSGKPGSAPKPDPKPAKAGSSRTSDPCEGGE